MARDRGLLLQFGRNPARAAVADIPGLNAFSLVTSATPFQPSAQAEALVTEEQALTTDLALLSVFSRLADQEKALGVSEPTLPAAGTNRRLTCFGSVSSDGQGRVEVLCAQQDSAAFAQYLAALDVRHETTAREQEHQ